jgi:hypothetical protein
VVVQTPGNFNTFQLGGLVPDWCLGQWFGTPFGSLPHLLPFRNFLLNFFQQPAAGGLVGHLGLHIAFRASDAVEGSCPLEKLAVNESLPVLPPLLELGGLELGGNEVKPFPHKGQV